MKRPAVFLGIPFVCGLVLASFLLPVSTVCGAVLLLSWGLLLVRKGWWRYIVVGTLSCLTACCLYWQADARSAAQLACAGQETVFTGTVSAVTVYESGYARYFLDGKLNGAVPARVEYFTDRTDLSYGEMVTLSGVPETEKTDHLFDGESYAKANGIFLRFDTGAVLLSHTAGKTTLRSMVFHWRKTVTDRLKAHMDTQTGAMLTGMLFGDKSGLSRSSRTALSRAGIGHVLAVSGLHLDLLALCAAGILKRLKADRKLSFLVMAGVCGLFVICAGETVSVERACIMVLLRQAAGVFYRKADSLNSLSIAMLILGIGDPFVVHSAAFWLSCCGACGMGVIAPYMTAGMPEKKWWQKLLKQMAGFCWVWAALFPASAVFFREISLISPLSNLLLVPVCMLAMLLGMAAVLLGGQGIPAELLLAGADRLCRIVVYVSETVAGLAWTYIPTGSVVLLFVLGAGLVLVTVCHCLERNKMHTAAAAVIAFVSVCAAAGWESSFQREDLQIAVLGEGRNCVVVLSGGPDAVVFDLCGASGSPAYADAYLSENGVERVESLFLWETRETSLRNYSRYFTFHQPEQICTFAETEETLFGAVPERIERRELLFHGAKVTVEASQVTVEYAGVTYVCTDGSAEIAGTPEILTLYGRNRTAPPECGILTVLDSESCCRPDAHTIVGENDLEVRIADDGKCRVRRL